MVFPCARCACMSNTRKTHNTVSGRIVIVPNRPDIASDRAHRSIGVSGGIRLCTKPFHMPGMGRREPMPGFFCAHRTQLPNPTATPCPEKNDPPAWWAVAIDMRELFYSSGYGPGLNRNTRGVLSPSPINARSFRSISKSPSISKIS